MSFASFFATSRLFSFALRSSLGCVLITGAANATVVGSATANATAARPDRTAILNMRSEVQQQAAAFRRRFGGHLATEFLNRMNICDQDVHTVLAMNGLRGDARPEGGKANKRTGHVAGGWETGTVI
jgi:hypothetical protein